MEDLVHFHLAQLLADEDGTYKGICKCDDCIADMEVYALNRLKTYYVTTKVGEVYGEYQNKEQQELADITKMLTLAIEEVRTKAHRPPQTEQSTAAVDGALDMFLRSVAKE